MISQAINSGLWLARECSFTWVFPRIPRTLCGPTRKAQHHVTQQRPDTSPDRRRHFALLAVMTPDGAVELVNRQILDYFAKTLHGLKEWTSTTRFTWMTFAETRL
jgi:hypothetical protein